VSDRRLFSTQEQKKGKKESWSERVSQGMLTSTFGGSRIKRSPILSRLVEAGRRAAPIHKV